MRSTSVAVASFFALLATAGCGGPGSTTEPASSGRAESGIVAYVNDGDTLRLTDGRRVRLLQIDAPELHGDCFGKASLSALLRVTPKGTRVRLESDPRLDARDGYGRLLRYLFVEGRNVNLELVRKGAASPYFYRKQRGRYADDLLDAVVRARSEKRGYWDACPRAELNTGVGSITGPS